MNARDICLTDPCTQTFRIRDCLALYLPETPSGLVVLNPDAQTVYQSIDGRSTIGYIVKKSSKLPHGIAKKTVLSVLSSLSEEGFIRMNNLSFQRRKNAIRFPETLTFWYHITNQCN